MKVTLLTALLLTSALAASAWPRKARSQGPGANNFIGDATDELSSAILQGYVDDNSNLAFSPLGYSVILAILAEGAHGETRQQLVTALKLPADQGLTRNTYFAIMDRLKNVNQYELNRPEFKNWFYVYKNYTIKSEYENILQKYYLTEVKSVEKYSDYIPENDEKPEVVKEEVEQIEPLPSVEIQDPVVSEIEPPKNLKYKSKDKKKVNSYKVQEAEEGLKDMYSEKIKEKVISFAIEDTPEETEEVEKYAPKNINEKIKLIKTFGQQNDEPLDDEDDEEIMEAAEARSHQRTAKGLYGKDDITSSLSANSVGSRNSKASNSLMLMFNGLYFRGSWAIPFQKVDLPEAFYVSPSEKRLVPVMRASGSFRSGSLPGLDSTAVELPYEGGRYALLIVVPRERDGLTRLVADLPGSPLSDLQTVLQTKRIEVRMPQFQVETTTKPLTALAKFGVSSIFGPDADLSGISEEEGLFVQEMVQHVSLKVVPGETSHNQLSAGEVSQPLPGLRGVFKKPSEDVEELETFAVDHPFLYFVRDVIDELIVVAGKVVNPEDPE